VDDELDPLGTGRADLEEPAGRVGTDQHREFVELEDSDGLR
jgi:hypothetical protein